MGVPRCMLILCFLPVICVASNSSRMPRQVLQWTAERRSNGQAEPTMLEYPTQNSFLPGSRYKFRQGDSNSDTIKLNIAFPQTTLALRANLSSTSRQDKLSLDYNPDVDLTTPKMVRRRGYPAQTHRVITEDGYILEMHRIPKLGAPPILLEHGILYSSATWVLAGPGKSLAYILSDAGYDVWIGNFRGNTYSRKHLYLKPEDPQFWDFSFHEMGMYDLPAEIDYILRLTRHEKLDYIGFSMGSTSFFIMTSKKPEYNQKIRQMHGLGPVAYMQGVRSPIMKLCPLMRNYQNIEFMPKSDFFKRAGLDYCLSNMKTSLVCNNLVFLIGGFDSVQTDSKLTPLIMAHTPAGTSFKSFSHYCQISETGSFKDYSYGYFENKKRYGSITPPLYNLSAISSPVYLHYADNDWLSHPMISSRLCFNLPNCKGKYRVPFAKFNHLDFMWAKDANTLLYQKILKLLRE